MVKNKGTSAEPALPRTRKRMKELGALERNDIISPKEPSAVAPGKAELGEQAVGYARKLGDALDNALNSFSDYYKNELESKVEQSLDEVACKARELKSKLSDSAEEIGENLKSFFKKIW